MCGEECKGHLPSSRRLHFLGWTHLHSCPSGPVRVPRPQQSRVAPLAHAGLLLTWVHLRLMFVLDVSGIARAPIPLGCRWGPGAQTPAFATPHSGCPGRRPAAAAARPCQGPTSSPRPRCVCAPHCRSLRCVCMCVCAQRCGWSCVGGGSPACTGFTVPLLHGGLHWSWATHVH